MSERIVSIKLQADATGMVQGLARARDAVAETKTKVEESARSSKQEWAQVGTGLTAVGVAVTGVGVAAIRTGIQYNTLQQTTRAALTTLLGSAQAANAQMDKLDAFARESPFSKQTFIKAQQQMLGFGVAAKDVVPALDSIQNAVAAMGGSNDQIAAISEIMSRIKSESRLSGDALQRLGYYGIDAAAIIGSQMGKTSAEIRDMAKKPGGIPVDQIWDPLVTGMQEKFGGAAAGVKNTFEGSMDRVKAAWRDFSAELARPLVDPNGGGALVDLLNWSADAMRNFQALPEPVKSATSAVVGLAGAGTLALGSAMLLLPKWYEFTDALKVFTANAGAARGAASGFAGFLTGPWGVALIAAASVVGVLVSENAKLSGQAKELAETLDGASGAITANSEAWAANQLQTEGVLSAAKRFGVSAKDMTDAWLGNDEALGRVNERLEKWRTNADFRDDNLFKGWSDDLVSLDYALDGSNKILSEAKTRHQELAEATAETSEATDGASSSAAGVADAYSEASAKATALEDALVGLIETFGELNGLGQSAEKTNSTLQESYASLLEYVENAQAGVEGYSTSLGEWSVAGAANRAMLADHAADVEKNAKAQFDLEVKTLGATAATASFEARLAAGRQQIYDTALALTGSAEEAQKLTDKILAVPDSAEIQVLLEGAQEATAQVDEFTRKVNLIPPYVSTEIRTFESLVYSEEGLKNKYGKASGGTIGYAVGGTIGIAAGQFVPGVGGGIASGTVIGRGTATSDSINVNLSRGEEVIRASEAAKHRPLLKQINAGQYSPGLQASSFAPSTRQQVVVMDRAVVEHVPSHVTVLDADNRLIGTMSVIADKQIDTYAEQQARENRRAGRR